MPPHVATCLNKLKGTPSHVRPTVLSAKPGERDPKRACRCHGPHSRAYRGQCLPSFMIIGSQKAATSKLRWYVSRHAEIRIPKEENFHKGPPPVAAWDTQTDPALLSRYLDNLDDVCDVPAISALKMPDYIVMSNLTIARFYAAAPTMRIVLTLREPIARMYSYFSMQLRLGWSPINHMGKNPCMQRMLRTLKVSKEAGAEARAEAGAAGRRLAGSNGSYKAGSNGSSKSGFTSEEIMRTNLECVRPCYGSDVAGEEMWHDEAPQQIRTPSPGRARVRLLRLLTARLTALGGLTLTDRGEIGHWCAPPLPPEWPTPRILSMAVQAQRECRNIYFTPLVHSMYALHLRRWLRIFPREPCSMVKRAVLAEAELATCGPRRPRSRARDALRLQSRAAAARGLQRRFGAPPRRHESSSSTAELGRPPHVSTQVLFAAAL